MLIRSNLKELNRKKDMVCLVLSYPPFNAQNNETHRGWILDVLEINHKVRESLHKPKNVSELSSEINRFLDHSIHDLQPFIPVKEIIEEMHRRSWFPGDTKPRNTMLDLCIDDFMTRQIFQYIQIPEIRRIVISEATDKTFLCKLKKLPPVRQMFDTVIHINDNLCLGLDGVEDRIIKELGFSKSSRGKADEFLRSKNFLILVEHFRPWTIDLHDLGNGWWNSDKTQKIALIGIMVNVSVPVDLEIRREDHLLSWNLFCRNVGKLVVHSSSIQPLAMHLLRQCCGHLLATVLIARALKDVEDVSIWRHACRAIDFLPTSQSTEDRILLSALAFVLGQLGSAANKCLKYCASNLEMEGTHKVDLLERWMKEDLIQTLDEGEQIVQQLVNAVLLESFQNGESIRMANDVRKELVNFYKAEMNPLLLVELDGKGLMEAPKSEAWEEAHEKYLMNTKISKLPDNPNCPLLSALFLQGNLHLRVISPSFFQFMPILQILNLSQTRIKSLPKSLFKLVQLRKFILRSCELFKELPVEIGELCHLEVLDLEDTEIINLPVSIGKLINLTSLKVSFYLPANGKRKNDPASRIIPQNVISRLSQLEELSIDVNPEDERWNATIKDVLKEFCCLNRLHFLKLYLPEVLLLNDLRNLSWMYFRFIVGDHLKRIVSRLPHESVIKFEEEGSCLKYVNGVGIPTEIKEVLRHATVFFLDRHLTATSLSEFGAKNMENLKFCVLQECKEIEAIVNVNDGADGDVRLHSLEYLSVHYMKNLRSICKGQSFPPWSCSLLFLKVLKLYSCPQLTTIFTWDLVGNLINLEEIVVEDYPKINSLLLRPDKPIWKRWYLRKLKKVSLHYMPKLVSVFGGEWIPESLEWLSFYDCPSLKILSPSVVHSSKLKVITGEEDWWSALKWKGSEGLKSRNLDDIFIAIERDIDLRTQLAAINDQLQAQMQITEPRKQSGWFSISLTLFKDKDDLH